MLCSSCCLFVKELELKCEMLVILCAFLLVYVASQSSPVRANSEPKYNVEILAFQPSSEYDKTWMDWNTMRFKKVSRNKFSMTGEFSLKFNMGNDQQVNLQAYTYNAASKKKGPMVYNTKKPFCKFMFDEYKETYQNMVKYSNLPESQPCPFPKGDYQFNNFIFETNFLPKHVPKGDYIVVLTLKDGPTTNVAGFEMEININ